MDFRISILSNSNNRQKLFLKPFKNNNFQIKNKATLIKSIGFRSKLTKQKKTELEINKTKQKQRFRM